MCVFVCESYENSLLGDESQTGDGRCKKWGRLVIGNVLWDCVSVWEFIIQYVNCHSRKTEFASHRTDT